MLTNNRMIRYFLVCSQTFLVATFIGCGTEKHNTRSARSVSADDSVDLSPVYLDSSKSSRQYSALVAQTDAAISSAKTGKKANSANLTTSTYKDFKSMVESSYPDLKNKLPASPEIVATPASSLALASSSYSGFVTADSGTFSVFQVVGSQGSTYTTKRGIGDDSSVSVVRTFNGKSGVSYTYAMFWNPTQGFGMSWTLTNGNGAGNVCVLAVKGSSCQPILAPPGAESVPPQL